jgi:hypothetical protein
MSASQYLYNRRNVTGNLYYKPRSSGGYGSQSYFYPESRKRNLAHPPIPGNVRTPTEGIGQENGSVFGSGKDMKIFVILGVGLLAFMYCSG